MSERPEVRWCKGCLMPSTRPRIRFDADGVCNACLTARAKPGVDWAERRKLLAEIVATHRGKNPRYDCIVPWSGGKDSSSIALKLREELGLNPLLVTFSPLVPSAVGNHNREALLRAGFDSIFVRPNQEVSRILARRFFVERGNLKVHWDAGVNAIPMQMALQHEISLVFYAEHGESEYGGHVLGEKNLMMRDLAEVLEHQIGDDPMNWVSADLEEKHLAPYTYPDATRLHEGRVKALYFAYFFPWDVKENYLYVRDHIDFHTAPGGRTRGTFTDYDSLDDLTDDLYYYMQYIKFGFGRAARDASRLIYRGKLTRPEALALARKYDGEFPSHTLKEVLDYLRMDEDALRAIVDKHREDWIWRKGERGDWVLVHPLE